MISMRRIGHVWALVFLAFSSAYSISKPRMMDRWVDWWYGSRCIKMQDITVDNYPQTYAYLGRLRAKYPIALSSKIRIVVTSSEDMGPCSLSRTILFPKSWIEALEAEIVEGGDKKLKQYQIEWVILHEAGHVHYGHVLTNVVLQNTPVMMLTQLALIYVRWKAEPQADSFACNLCDNKEAMLAAIELLKNEAVDDLAHPSIKSRIAKIEKAIQKKF